MLKDAFENPVATLSPEARDAYNLGVSRFLGAELGVSDAFEDAIDADIKFLNEQDKVEPVEAPETQANQ